MTNNKEIEEQIKQLENLKFKVNAKTKDGVPIEIGGVYYKLENLREGFEEYVVEDTARFDEYRVTNKPNEFGFGVQYDRLFSTKEAAWNHMLNYVITSIESHKSSIRSFEGSLELLENLKGTLEND